MNDISKNEMLLSRQLILDRKQEIVGYELSLASSITVEGESETKLLDSELLVCSVYMEFGVRNALGNHKAYLQIDPDFLHNDLLETLSADSVILELVVNDVPDKRVIDRCIDLHKKQYPLAYTNYIGFNERVSPLLSLLSVVKIDIAKHSKAHLKEIISPIVNLPIKILAVGIDSQADIDLCMELGFHLFQGNYFSRPEIVEGRHLSPTQLGLIQLINLANKDVDNDILEEKIKKEPALAINLLCIVNSADRGLSKRVSSLKDAITVLGRKKLQRWLQLLLMMPTNASPDVTKSPILQVAVLRGRMMEMLVKHVYPYRYKLIDQSFITGVMSVMPIALGIPIEEIAEHISLEPEVVNALTAKTDSLGLILNILDCFDHEYVDKCDELMESVPEPGLNRQLLNKCLVESLRWINEIDE